MSIGVEESGSSASGGFVGGVGLLVVAPLDDDVVVVVLLVGGGVVLLGGGGIGGGVESLGMIRPPRKLFITSANFLGKSRGAGFESRLVERLFCQVELLVTTSFNRQFHGNG